MGFQGPRTRTHNLAHRVRPGLGAGRTLAEMSPVDGQDAADAVQQLRETCHDMRQPVAAVLALTGAALSEPALPQTVRVRLEQIVQQAESLADMIQEWLYVAQKASQVIRADSAERRDRP
jgi:signal transduction histidine kinase